MTDYVTDLNYKIHVASREGNENERYHTAVHTCSVILAGGSELEADKSRGSRSPSPPPVLSFSLPVVIPLIAILQLPGVTVVIRGWNVRARMCSPKVPPDRVASSRMKGKSAGTFGTP